MKKMSLPKKVKISNEVLFQEIEGEAVLLNMANEKYFGLDEVGTRIWHLLLKDEITTNTLTSLQKEYDVDSKTLETDLAKLIFNLNEQGLVSIEN